MEYIVLALIVATDIALVFKIRSFFKQYRAAEKLMNQPDDSIS